MLGRVVKSHFAKNEGNFVYTKFLLTDGRLVKLFICTIRKMHKIDILISQRIGMEIATRKQFILHICLPKRVDIK